MQKAFLTVRVAICHDELCPRKRIKNSKSLHITVFISSVYIYERQNVETNLTLQPINRLCPL